MSIIEAIILGIVQGLTEFIPISSSGHLLLLHHLLGITENGLAFDVALHIGTLLSLLIFFYKDITTLTKDLIIGGAKRRLALILALATIPAVIAGVLLQDKAETSFRSPYLVCLMLGGMALFMLVAERYIQRRQKPTELGSISIGQGLVVGVAQAVALIPGVSRSGSTITTGLFAGLGRVAATRFSFLLSIPITFGAILKIMIDSDNLSAVGQDTGLFVVGIISAFLSGLIAIKFLLKFVTKHSLDIFAYYRLVLAGLVFLALAIF